MAQICHITDNNYIHDYLIFQQLHINKYSVLKYFIVSVRVMELVKTEQTIKSNVVFLNHGLMDVCLWVLSWMVIGYYENVYFRFNLIPGQGLQLDAASLACYKTQRVVSVEKESMGEA